jgi:hypothetical protein
MSVVTAYEASKQSDIRGGELLKAKQPKRTPMFDFLRWTKLLAISISDGDIPT